MSCALCDALFNQYALKSANGKYTALQLNETFKPLRWSHTKQTLALLTYGSQPILQFNPNQYVSSMQPATCTGRWTCDLRTLLHVYTHIPPMRHQQRTYTSISHNACISPCYWWRRVAWSRSLERREVLIFVAVWTLYSRPVVADHTVERYVVEQHLGDRMSHGDELPLVEAGQQATQVGVLINLAVRRYYLIALGVIYMDSGIRLHGKVLYMINARKRVMNVAAYIGNNAGWVIFTCASFLWLLYQKYIQVLKCIIRGW